MTKEKVRNDKKIVMTTKKLGMTKKKAWNDKRNGMKSKKARNCHKLSEETKVSFSMAFSRH